MCQPPGGIGAGYSHGLMRLWIDAVDVINEQKRWIALDNAEPMREGQPTALARTAVGGPSNADRQKAVCVWNGRV